MLHLGDYLYEYGIGEYGDVPDRDPVPPHEMVTLEDYRQRHAQYKGDVDLQAVHQQYPMIVIWDDHESTNDSYQDGAGDNQPVSLSAGKVLGFMVAYCDNDYSELRENFIGSEYAAGDDKDRGYIDAGLFGALELVD